MEVTKETGVRTVEEGFLPGGFEGQPGGALAVKEEAGIAAAVAREEATIKASIAIAKRFPRDEANAYAKIIQSARRIRLAEKALYEFPRGGRTIEGPSVHLARECARIWGNIRTGIQIVSDDGERIHIKGFAYDAETNTLFESEAKPKKLIQRKNKQTGETQWIEPDERDLRELVNKHGAICERNAILRIIPSDIIDEAIEEVKQTIRKGASGKTKQDREQAIRRIVLAFGELGVTRDMIEKYLGHKLESMKGDEFTKMSGIYTSINEGNSNVEEYFDISAPKGAAERGQIDPSKISEKESGEKSKGNLFDKGK